MKNIAILLFLLLPVVASAQMSFDTGNARLETDLNSINARANLDFGAFKTELSIGYNISEKKIEYMHGSLEMAPGEIYLALEISKISKRPIDDILCIYNDHGSKGWGYIAKQVGIKPGSEEFHQLKRHSKYKSKGHSKGKGNGKGNGKGKKR
ncbi:hypothetical protein [Carboxylicivirga taeanensis]|uniref:hypothetical protein n=1 Tax=Carboxylicivirga taeanensis TaxID=1416875 RepID=UPI003F6DF66B